MTLAHPEPWSVDDLDALPEDGQRHELINGQHIVSPAPSTSHQRMVTALTAMLYYLINAHHGELEVLCAPFDYRPDLYNSVEPDLLVFRREDVGPARLEKPPLLVIEILSPGTRSRDLVRKRDFYQRHHIPTYWIADPNPENPSITVLQLDAENTYIQTEYAQGNQPLHTKKPFPITLVPAGLVS